MMVANTLYYPASQNRDRYCTPYAETRIAYAYFYQEFKQKILEPR